MATIRKRGTRWQAQVRITGHAPVSKSFGSKPEALSWTLSIEADLTACTGYSAAEGSLRDLLKRYQRSVSIHKKSYLKEKYLIKSICKHRIADIAINKLIPKDVADYRDDRLKTIKPASLLREIAIIRHAINVAKKEWSISLPANPVYKVAFPSASDARSVRLDKFTAKRLAKALDQSPSLYLKAFVRLAIITGMRRSELLALTWERIDLKARTATLPDTKNGHKRVVALAPAAMAVLIAQDARTGRLFPVTANAVRLAWDRLRRRWKLPVRMHDLRHEAISSMFELGLSIPEVAMQAGHRDYRMLSRYTHLRPEQLALKLKDLGKATSIQSHKTA